MGSYPYKDYPALSPFQKSLRKIVKWNEISSHFLPLAGEKHFLCDFHPNKLEVQLRSFLTVMNDAHIAGRQWQEACERRAGMSDYPLLCWPNSPNHLPCFTFIPPDSNAVAHFQQLQTCTECVSVCETSPHYSRQSGQQCLHADIMKTPQRPGGALWSERKNKWRVRERSFISEVEGRRLLTSAEHFQLGKAPDGGQQCLNVWHIWLTANIQSFSDIAMAENMHLKCLKGNRFTETIMMVLY